MGPFAPEVYRLPFAYAYRWPGGPERCAEEALAYAVDEMHKHIGEDNIACVVLEPIQGEGGFIVPAPGFVKGIADFYAAHGIVFVADEIQSGMGRAGRWIAIESEDVRPDIVTSAKSLDGGVIVLPAGTYGNVVRLLPPLTIEEPLLADGLDVLEGAVDSALR